MPVSVCWIVVPPYRSLRPGFVDCLSAIGTELFPEVDSGKFVLRFRTPPGTNFNLTREAWVRCLQVIEEEAGKGNVDISMGFAGQQAPNYSVNNMLLFMRAPDDGQIRVALREGCGVSVAGLRDRLRKALPDHLIPWFTGRLEMEGLSKEEAKKRASEMIFGFEPGDIVGVVMSFGSPTPIEVVIASPDLRLAQAYADRVMAEMGKIPWLRDLQIQQTLAYPTVPINIDRQKAGLSGVNAQQVGQSVLVTTSSSRMVARNFWQDPRSGVSYQVQVQVPTQRMDSTTKVETIPLEPITPSVNLMLRDVATAGSHHARRI